MKGYLIASVLLVVILGSIGGYIYQRFSAFADMDFSPPPVTVATSEAIIETRSTYLNAVGTIQAVRGVELTSETSGEVTKINFASGDQVTAGQLLVVLNDEVEKASRENQTAALELAQILFDRDAELIEQKSIPQTQYDSSRADLARATAQLGETEARLANKRISAPFAGTMGIRKVDVGDYVSPGTVIANLQDKSELEIDFTAPARFAPKIRAGQPVSVSVDALPNQIFAAVIQAVDSKIDPGTRNILIRAKLKEVTGLVPGMFATLEVDLEEAQQVVTVPETALTYALQGDTVYILEASEDGGQTAVAKVVETTEVRDGRVAVLDGLQGGEQVITVGQNKLFRGVKVVVDESVAL